MTALHANTGTRIDRPRDGVQPAASASRFVEAGGLRLHHLDYGTAGRPAMLCAHGGAAHAHWYDFVAPGFSADYHVRSLDHRGHGDSAWAEPPAYSYEHYASDVAKVVEKLDLRDFVLIGHSMGGMISLVYAANHPGRVSRLIIVDSRLKITADFVAESHNFGTRQGRSYATRDELVARYRLRPTGTTAAPEIIRYLAQNSARQQADGSWRHKFDRNVYIKRKFVDSLSCWNRIRIPALLVKGEHSRRITPQIYAEVKARCPHLELTEVPNSYHHVMLDNPSGFVHAVKTFLDKHS